MKKFNKFFITALVAGLVALSSALAIPTQMAQALIKTEQIENNAITSPKIKDGEVKTPDLATAAVTKEKLNPSAVKLIVITRSSDSVPIQVGQFRTVEADCNSNEILTGGGYGSQGNGLRVVENNPSGGSWSVGAVNDGTNEGAVRAHALCAHLELGP